MSHKHVYAIPAYGDSPYLESCIKSLKAQNVTSPVILCTSTPSPFLGAMAEKYDLPTTSGKEKAISGMTGTMLIPWQMQSLSLLPIRTICTAKLWGRTVKGS